MGCLLRVAAPASEQTFRSELGSPLGLSLGQVVALLVAVAFGVGVASSGALWDVGGSNGVLDFRSPGFTVTALVLFPIVGALLVFMLWHNRHVERGSGRQAFELLAIAAIAAVAAGLLFGGAPKRETGARAPTSPPVRTLQQPPAHAADGGTGFTLGTWWWIAAALVLAVGGAAALRTLTPEHAPEVEPEVDEQLEDVRESITLTLADVEREPDPRVAVIKAYATLELALDGAGLPRRAVETALEYLQRVLGAFSVTRVPLERLTSLYHEAKFSAHPVDAEMKRDAISALAAIQDQLEAAS